MTRWKNRELYVAYNYVLHKNAVVEVVGSISEDGQEAVQGHTNKVECDLQRGLNISGEMAYQAISGIVGMSGR